MSEKQHMYAVKNKKEYTAFAFWQKHVVLTAVGDIYKCTN